MDSYDLIAIEVVKAVHMHPKTLDITIKSCIKKQAIYANKYIFSNEDIKKVENHILSDEFLSPLSKEYSKVFTKEELKELYKFYRSDLMNKFNDNCEKFMTSVFSAIDKYIEKFGEED